MSSMQRIFVAIAAYRDSECQHTIRDLFDKASYPDDVFVGVCFQRHPTHDEHCFQVMTREPQVRWCFFDHTDAQGPCWARAQVQKLWRGEEYYLQIDSHMRFCAGWDRILIDLVNESDKAICTTYPPGYERSESIESIDPTTHRPTILCASHFDNSDGMLRLRGRELSDIRVPRHHSKVTLIPSRFWAAGFAFCRSTVIEEVPYDPQLKHLFFGEEQSMSARLWTHGWNFYCPSRTIALHLWSREYRPVFRSDEDINAGARARVAKLFSRDDDGGCERPYGLGSVRTLEEYESFSGVNFSKKEVTIDAWYGGVNRESLHEFANANVLSLINSFIRR